ncbi:hypothetical protein TNIN_333791 [Trichonephila inaurata madagascariensis]|uniref:Uncharacterized protein n=1 Tax=Trichonephila inaurata madagascariensis TaxID=2747483 RepID=A0A8X7CJN2_9ARAC|nr:hypothetical protein TNIN_333791 [Trichonephila inaurata madagascariensis]
MQPSALNAQLLFHWEPLCAFCMGRCVAEVFVIDRIPHEALCVGSLGSRGPLWMDRHLRLGDSENVFSKAFRTMISSGRLRFEESLHGATRLTQQLVH